MIPLHQPFRKFKIIFIYIRITQRTFPLGLQKADYVKEIKSLPDRRQHIIKSGMARMSPEYQCKGYVDHKK